MFYILTGSARTSDCPSAEEAVRAYGGVLDQLPQSVLRLTLANRGDTLRHLALKKCRHQATYWYEHPHFDLN